MRVFLCAAFVSAALAWPAAGQYVSLDGPGPMRIPTLEELSKPYTPRVATPIAPEDAEGPLGKFLNDETLRTGDIVVTPDGPMQYRGAGALTHGARDFAPAPVEPRTSGAYPVRPPQQGR